jgi:hypothetical protein
VPPGDLSGSKEKNMKLIRLTLVCSLLLLAAVPSFAIGCRSCDGLEYPYCISTPDSGTRCEIGVDYCITRSSSFCSGFSEQTAAAPAVLAEWNVASIEISRPAEGTKVVTAPAVVADANLSR